MTNEELKSSKTRKPYQKPQINRVRLAVEEAVLTVCKTASTIDPGSDPCNYLTNPCVDAGS